ncbi:hypothetical protein [Cellvibrio sp. KY-YJ-3]|uniref:hypothetical protein n=1 Tax=Cellvibrio sp. KY-YJ-3 TaxID=454662 RepID=UPI0012476078|nr:hypothetical protein [Cellvibrio sp. KY-YJ-3]
MNNVTLIAAPFFSLFLLFIFIAITIPKKREPYEKGLTPEFEEICGGRINFFNYTWPFLRHSIYKEFIVVKSIFGAHMLPRESLSEGGANGILSQGIRYVSPKHVGCEFRIWTSNKKQVMEIFKGKA